MSCWRAGNARAIVDMRRRIHAKFDRFSIQKCFMLSEHLGSLGLLKVHFIDSNGLKIGQNFRRIKLVSLQFINEF